MGKGSLRRTSLKLEGVIACICPLDVPSPSRLVLQVKTRLLGKQVVLVFFLLR